MAKPIAITGDWTASELRRLAAASRHANQSRRLLSLAAVLDGMNRTEAARIGGMDRQTLRDWVHRFNERGPEGLKDDLARPRPRRLTAAQEAELAAIVETGPDRAVHGVVRWRRVDLRALVATRFGVEYHERTTGKLLKTLGFSHVSARPRHPKQDGEVIQAFKKTSRARSKPMLAG
jgi:transposase